MRIYYIRGVLFKKIYFSERVHESLTRFSGFQFWVSLWSRQSLLFSVKCLGCRKVRLLKLFLFFQEFPVG